MNRVLAAFGAAVSIAMGGLAAAPLGWSDPIGPTGDQDAVTADPPGEMPPAPVALTDAASGSPVSDACKQFGAALAVAATNYEDFAYATAGSGNYVDYRDPTVGRSNVVGTDRTAGGCGGGVERGRDAGAPVGGVLAHARLVAARHQTVWW